MSVAASYPHRFQYWFQANKLLEDIATLPSPQEQKEVIQLALVFFDHHDTKEHDELVEAGAITILTRRLQRVMHGKQDDQAQMDPLCLLLCMVLRCSNEFAEEAFKGIGTDLVSVLFDILLQEDNKEDCALAEAVSSVCPLLDRLSSLVVSLEEVEKSNQLIGLLQYFFQKQRGHDVKVQMHAIKMLSGLTQHPDSKIYASRVGGLLEDVLGVAMESASTEMQLYSAKILKHFSWESRNKALLLKKKDFLKLLLNLNTVDLDTSLEVLLSLLQLSTDKEAKTALVSYDNGAVLKALTEAAKNTQLLPTAIDTILYLVARSTAPQIISQEALLATVLSTAVGSTPSATTAAQTLKRLATFIPVGDSSHPNLMDAVVSISASKIAQVRLWAAKALVEQSRMMATAFYIARDTNVMDTLLRLAMDSSNLVKAAAVETLLNLSNDQSNVKRIAVSEDALQILQHVVESDGKDQASCIARRRAVQVLLTLANHRSAKSRVAKQLGLVTALSKFAVSQDPDEELKHAALHGVIILAPLM